MQKIHYAWIVLAGCCMIQVGGLGNLANCLGIYVDPVCADLKISTTAFSLYFTLQAAAMAISATLCGNLMKKFGVRKCLIIAALAATLIYGGFAFADQVWHFYLLALIVGPVLNIVIVLAVPSLITAWFDAKKGLAMGVAMACAGIGGAFFNLVLSMIISEYSWRAGYLCMAIICLLLLMPAALWMIKDDPREIGQMPYSLTKGETDSVSSTAIEEIEAKAITKNPVFWFVFTAAGLTTYVCTFVTYLPAYGSSLGLPAWHAGAMLSAAMIGNMLGALSLGYLVDRWGALKTEFFGGILILFAIAMLLCGQYLNRGLIAAALIFGLSSAMYSTMNPLLVHKVFGSKDYAKIFSYVSIGMLTMSAAACVLIGLMHDFSGGYMLGFVTAAAAYVIVLLMVWLSLRNKV